jgi:hypothetical protein
VYFSGGSLTDRSGRKGTESSGSGPSQRLEPCSVAVLENSIRCMINSGDTWYGFFCGLATTYSNLQLAILSLLRGALVYSQAPAILPVYDTVLHPTTCLSEALLFSPLSRWHH